MFGGWNTYLWQESIMKSDNLTSTFLALRDKLHRSAMRFLRCDEDARDALQDTFCKLWDRGQIESDAEARNKLFVVLRNVCIDRLREAKAVSLDDSAEAEIAVTPYTDDSAERLEALMMSQLTDLQRRIFSRIVHDGMEYEEVAAELEMSVDAVRMNMSRVRKRLRETFRENRR